MSAPKSYDTEAEAQRALAREEARVSLESRKLPDRGLTANLKVRLSREQMDYLVQLSKEITPKGNVPELSTAIRFLISSHAKSR